MVEGVLLDLARLQDPLAELHRELLARMDEEARALAEQRSLHEDSRSSPAPGGDDSLNEDRRLQNLWVELVARQAHGHRLKALLVLIAMTMWHGDDKPAYATSRFTQLTSQLALLVSETGLLIEQEQATSAEELGNRPRLEWLTCQLIRLREQLSN
jgi:hypothetical protein